MAVLPYDRSPSRLPVWLGAGGITILVVLGIVVIGLPLQCNLGLTWDNTCPAGTAGATTIRSSASAGQSSNVAGPAAAALATPAKPQNLVAATFGRLGNAATHPQAVAAPPAASLAAAASAPPAKAGELATRLVKTLAIGPDGAVLDAAGSPAAAGPVALAAPLSTAGDSAPSLSSSDAQPATVADAPIPLPPLKMVSAAPPAAATPAPATDNSTRVAAQAPAPGGSERVVGGSGVTVRSLPGRNGARLFALSGGEHVTVSGTQRGWLHVTDAQGQSGWAYSSFFTGAKS